MPLETTGSPDFKKAVKSVDAGDIVQTSEDLTTVGNKDALNDSDKDVASAGTGENLPDTSIPNGVTVFIQAKSTNTNKVYLASSKAKAEGKEASGARALEAKDYATYKINNLNLLWIDAEVTGEGVIIYFEDDA